MGNPEIVADRAVPLRTRNPLARVADIGWIRRMHDALALRVRSSHWVTRALLGVDPAEPGIIHWDYTTLMMCRTVRPLLRDGLRVWDLGCGPEATVTRFMKRLANVSVVASDADTDSVTRARRAVANQVPVLLSDLGESVTGTFDLILFNAPYLPLGNLPPGRPLEGPEAERFVRRLGGGADGLATIRRFLAQVRPFMANGGRALLGWNCFYVSLDSVLREVEAVPELRAARCVRSWWNPSSVLVLEAA